MKVREELKCIIKELRIIKNKLEDCKNNNGKNYIYSIAPPGECEEEEIDLKIEYENKLRKAKELERKLMDDYNKERNKKIKVKNIEHFEYDEKIKKRELADKKNGIRLNIIFGLIIFMTVLLGIVTFYSAFNYNYLIDKYENIEIIYPLIKGSFENLLVSCLLAVVIFKYKYYLDKTNEKYKKDLDILYERNNNLLEEISNMRDENKINNKLILQLEITVQEIEEILYT